MNGQSNMEKAIGTVIMDPKREYSSANTEGKENVSETAAEGNESATEECDEVPPQKKHSPETENSMPHTHMFTGVLTNCTINISLNYLDTSWRLKKLEYDLERYLHTV